MQIFRSLIIAIAVISECFSCTIGPGPSHEKRSHKHVIENQNGVHPRPGHAINTLFGSAVKIVDGDTFDLIDSSHTTRRIRLHGIDCPEKKQDFYQVAKDHLSQLIVGKNIKAVQYDTDRNGRLICIVYSDGVNINEAMLQAGLAWHFKKYDQNSHWASMEEEAAKNKIGLWSLPNPIAPWDWRHR